MQPSSNGTSKEKTSSTVRRLTWGIFDIARDMFRLFLEAYRSDRLNTFMFFSCHVWLCASPAISLFFAFRTLRMIKEQNDLSYAVSVTCWIVSVSISTLVRRKIDVLAIHLAGRLRVRLLPRLARASLRLDMKYADLSSCGTAFPDLWSFGTSPEMNTLRQFFARLSDILRVIIEIPMFAWILCSSTEHPFWIFSIVGILVIGFSIFAPLNCIGGAGYTFWTNNPAFYRLQAFYSIVFDPTYRETICKNGTTDRLAEEITAASNDLGVHDIDTMRLSCSFKPIHWFWELGQSIILEHPIAIVAIIWIWSPATSVLLSMALIQYGASIIKADFYSMRGGPSITDVMRKAQMLYRTIDEVEDKRPFICYPTSTSSPAGMKISFRDACVTYERKSESVDAVKNVSIDIEPGLLVVIVGKNGSGKSSLLKLLPRVTQLSSGDILIDDKSINEYDIKHLRDSMAILFQDERIFPLSLRDNMLLGMPERVWRHRSKSPLDDLVHSSSVLGGAQNIIRNVGWDTVLNPIAVIRQSTEGMGNGKIEGAAFDEMDQHAVNVKPYNISAGERQRLIATRAIARTLDNDDIKLVVVDEPTSALDPIAERALFNNFIRMRKGRTMIFVTHRIWHLVEHADLVLCMEEGKLVESGTHAELVAKANGSYANLYNAQKYPMAAEQEPEFTSH